MGSKKRPLAGGAAAAAGRHDHHHHHPRTPDARHGQAGHAGGPSKKKHKQQKQALPAHLAAVACPHPALARPDSARWWPAPADFEAVDEDEGGGGDAQPPPPPQPQTLVVAGDWRPAGGGGGGGEGPPPPRLDLLASSAGPPGGPTAGRAVLAALIAPVAVETFMASVYEGRPLHIKHRGPGAAAAYAALFSSADFEAWVGSGRVRYGTALDVVRFDGAVRHTLNYNTDGRAENEGADGLADPAVVARRLSSEGCSARVLHPQRRSPALASVMCALEGFFGCVVGCNAYLTPAGGAQGFAPHADGVGVFILQAEGRKRWRAHGPRARGEVLPLDSSPDLAPGEVGPTLVDAVLEPGDLLYLPRGVVHQADTPPLPGGGGSVVAGPAGPGASLHLTISVSDGRGGGTWADLLAVALPRALELAAGRCLALRRAVPPGVVGGALGVAAEDSGERAGAAAAAGAAAPASAAQRPGPPYAARAAARAAAQAAASHAAAAVLAALPLDAAADALAADFVRRRLPPPRPKGAGSGPAPPAVRPVAEGTAARLVVEAGSAVVYHCMDNKVADHACGRRDGEGDGEEGDDEGAGRLVLPLESAPAVETLLGVHSPRPGFSAVVLAEVVEGMGGGEEAEAAVREAADAMWGAGLLEQA